MIEVDLAPWAILLIVGLTALLEDSVGLGVILPAETVVIGAAAAAATGAVNVWAVFGVAWACGVAGDFVGFSIGRHFGDRLLHKYGPKLKLTPERQAQAAGFVQRWGVLGVAAGRFIPAVRILVMPVAGISGMAPAVFLIGDVVGVAGWAALHVATGYLVGTTISDHIGADVLIILLLIVAGVLVGLLMHHRHIRRTERNTGESEPKSKRPGDDVTHRA